MFLRGQRCVLRVLIQGWWVPFLKKIYLFIQKLSFLSLPDVLMVPEDVCSQPGGWQAVEGDELGL